MRTRGWASLLVVAGLVLAVAIPVLAQVEPVNDGDTTGSRIGIRQVDGVAEFFRTDGGERFVPRGVNYIDFIKDENGNYRDAVFATETYDRERVREAFQALSSRGYNTARIFFDTCGVGRSCIGIPGGSGLQPEYLDNIAEVMRIAADEGIYLLLTANSIPDDGGYWDVFDRLFETGHEGFTRRENADYLHTAGVETKALFWEDLMAGLVDREAPFEAVLGWQLTNEQWLFREFPPMSLDSGFAETANGQRYDLAKPGQKRRMVADGVVYLIDRLREVVGKYDSEGLVTMGWYAPAFQPEWYVDTEPLLARANVDFFDFHAYADTELSVRQQAKSFGMLGYAEKPILMGETGVGKAIIPTAVSAAANMQQWIADSCTVGFDGWLNWGYYPWPDDQSGAAWAFLDDDGRMLDALAPINEPDACASSQASADLARSSKVTATRSDRGQPPRNAIDGKSASWVAGDFPPQTLTFKLGRPGTVGQLGLAVDQWPPGPTHHRVWATLRDGSKTLVADIERYLHGESTLDFIFDPPLPGVVRLDLQTIKSPSWVGWREVSIVATEAGGAACRISASVVRPDPRSSAPASTRLARGQRVLAEARLSSDARWLRVPGDHWVRAGIDECPDLPLVDGPSVDLVPVTFLVDVPRASGEVFITGAFSPETTLPAWNPATVLLQPRGRRHRVTLPLPRGERLEYAYTEGGSWDGVEAPSDCSGATERVLTVEPGLVVRDSVDRWRSDC